MRKPIIKRGDKYNRLTAIKFDHMGKGGNAYWLFRCDCNNEKVIVVNSVKQGHTRSCGCLSKEKRIKRLTTHGMTHTKEYRTWANMKQRCLYKKRKDYKNYGGRGIIICKRWLKFENFYEDMGKLPIGASLDRIDNNNNYEPNNCKWATRKQQNNNTRRNHFLTYKSRTKTIAQWADETGINYMALWLRIKRGWSIKKTLNK